ncbi:MAG TPA: lipocalin family protein [Casimicrobiaceae bacterium]|nr:lipocalin family protein [Casimicrobiaceae bacterium]
MSILPQGRGPAALAPWLLAAWISSAAALVPVASFDLNRYLGTWYEIAAIPGFLQSRCARDTRLEYSDAENGAIASNSRCVRADGSMEQNESRHRPLDPDVPAVLKITSVHFLGIWWYPFGRESIVLAVGPDYRWMVVGHPSLRYGRIMSRQPSLDDADLRQAAAALADQQFDLCSFIITPQTGGRGQAGRLCDLVQ